MSFSSIIGMRNNVFGFMAKNNEICTHQPPINTFTLPGVEERPFIQETSHATILCLMLFFFGLSDGR